MNNKSKLVHPENIISIPEPISEPHCYRIQRYKQSGRMRRTIRSNVTLTEAQTHCSRSDSKGPGWFDGYDYMPGCNPKK